MSLLPKEHGAYGQISFPLFAAFAVAGLSPGGLFLATAMIAGFLAHEPALVLLGLRGPRTKRELGAPATRWLGCCLAAGLAAGTAGLLRMPPSVRWSIAVPLVPATLLIAAALRGSEKSWYGETATALTCAGAAVPVSMAAGVSLLTSARVAIPFALLFVSSTLAVRVVILRVRRGGDLAATAATRRAALILAVVSSIVLVLASRRGWLPPSILAATAPGLLTAAAVAVRPPAPSRLRTLGWTLVVISVLTTAIIVTTV